FVADGVFYAELNEFFTRELAAENYAGVEVRVTPAKTEIINVSQPQKVLGEKGRHIRELTALNFMLNAFSSPGLCAVAQCESLKFKLLNGLAVRRAAHGVLRYIMESGAKGCEVVVSGKLRAARAKAMKFADGFMIHSGQPAKEFIDQAVRHIMLDWDPTGKNGPKKPLPDMVTILEPKEEAAVVEPISEDFKRPEESVVHQAEVAPIEVIQN
ncbi:40S ribosomal protein S3, partial [Massospora cicadina]